MANKVANLCRTNSCKWLMHKVGPQTVLNQFERLRKKDEILNDVWKEITGQGKKQIRNDELKHRTANHFDGERMYDLRNIEEHACD